MIIICNKNNPACHSKSNDTDEVLWAKGKKFDNVNKMCRLSVSGQLYFNICVLLFFYKWRSCSTLHHANGCWKITFLKLFVKWHGIDITPIQWSKPSPSIVFMLWSISSANHQVKNQERHSADYSCNNTGQHIVQVYLLCHKSMRTWNWKMSPENTWNWKHDPVKCQQQSKLVQQQKTASMPALWHDWLLRMLNYCKINDLLKISATKEPISRLTPNHQIYECLLKQTCHTGPL